MGLWCMGPAWSQRNCMVTFSEPASAKVLGGGILWFRVAGIEGAQFPLQDSPTG